MDYQDLLAAAKRNPAGADYHALRMAYARSDAYQPYNDDPARIDALRMALEANDTAAALRAVAALLEANYLDIEAHMTADYLRLTRGDVEQSAYHRAFAQGLINAILATGSGSDFGSAFIVLRVPEEYVVLRVLKLIPAGQQLVEHEGQYFDVLTARHRDTEQAVELYFNIDIPRRWLGNNLIDFGDDQ